MINPGYPNIFDPTNCSLISNLLPPKAKQFVFDFMNGDLFRNPIQQAAELLKGSVGDAIAQSNFIKNSSGLASEVKTACEDLNDALTKVNNEMSNLIAHTNRLSGIGNGLPALDQIIGVMSTYNSIKDLMKDPNQRLEDNFSNAFSSLNPQIVGPFFENFAWNMNEISAVLGEVGRQLNAGGLTGPGEFAETLSSLASNIGEVESNIKSLIKNDEDAYKLALAAVERYVIGNTIISTVLTDPCFGAQLLQNLITKPDAAKQLSDVAQESGIKIENSPINLLDYIPSLAGKTPPGST